MRCVGAHGARPLDAVSRRRLRDPGQFFGGALDDVFTGRCGFVDRDHDGHNDGGCVECCTTWRFHASGWLAANDFNAGAAPDADGRGT